RGLLVSGERMNLEAWRSMVRSRPGTEFQCYEDFYVHSYPLPTESLNEARVTGPPRDPVRLVAEATAYFAPRAARWRIACPPQWEHLLEGACREAGLRSTPAHPVMGLRSDAYRPPPTVEGFVPHRVEDLPTLESFGRTFARANEIPDAGFWRGHALLEAPGWDFILGRLRHEPAATGVGYTFGGTTGVWGIATDPAFRGRGLGSAITWAVILAGARRGAEATYLWATELGFPVYRRMGFRHLQNEVTWVTPGPDVPEAASISTPPGPPIGGGRKQTVPT
ncbi:MAG: GNAT family N-acetyltransferase, partial [Thermoplasmata archaeon]